MSSEQCKAPAVAPSNNIVMTVHPLLPASVSMVSSVGNSGCETVPVTFTATPVNGGTIPVYQWLKNGNPVGTNANAYTDASLVTGNIISVMMTSNALCPTPATATSNAINMTINPLLNATVAITVSPDSVGCDQKEYVFSSHFTNGGATQRYKWKLNGVYQIANTHSTYKAKTFTDGDNIECVFISSATCAFPDSSNIITMRLHPSMDAQAEIWAVALEGGLRFESKVVNGGTNPTYQWLKNNADIPGATQATYFMQGMSYSDVVAVRVGSNEHCVKSEYVVSNGLSYMKATGVNNAVSAIGELKLYPNPNEGRFTITGTINANTAQNDNVIEILNSIGQVIYKEQLNIYNGKLDVSVNLGGNPAAGMYNVRLHIGNKTESLRFVVTR